MRRLDEWRRSGREKRMPVFLFPPRRDSKTGQPKNFRLAILEQEGGPVRARPQGVRFMATVRGPKKDLATYLPKE